MANKPICGGYSENTIKRIAIKVKDTEKMEGFMSGKKIFTDANKGDGVKHQF